MTRLRALVWLIAVVAFVVPAFGTTMAGHAMAAAMTPVMMQGEQAASVDCPEHAPPPDCPAQGTAKHAAGQCCPMMSCTFAMLAPTMVADVALSFAPDAAAVARSLTGLVFTKDPPPPRV